MTPVHGKIIVRCDLKQKDTFKIGDVEVSTAHKFESNFREKSPTVCCVVHGNAYVKEGDILLAHHNTFYTPSPFFLQDDLFSIPAQGNILFAIVNKDGSLTPILGNIICQRIEIPTPLPVPPELVKTYTDRAKVIDPGTTSFKKDQLLAHRPSAGYDMVYYFNGIEKRVTKVPDWQVCGILS